MGDLEDYRGFVIDLDARGRNVTLEQARARAHIKIDEFYEKYALEHGPLLAWRYEMDMRERREVARAVATVKEDLSG